jgi:pimeloyl-ACP methyl ester carboxylesterase
MMNNQSLYKSVAGERAVMALYDKVLALWPVAYQTLTIPTRHGETFVIASGEESAPALVLLHGAGSNSTIWAADVGEYSRQYRVYAVDLLGEPGRSAPNRPPWDSPAYAEWLEDVFNALKIESGILIGISQGGWAALKFSVYQPERVEKLALLTPGGVIPDKLSFLIRVIPWLLLGRRGVEPIKRILFGNQPASAEADEFTTVIMSHFKSRVGKLPIFSDAELQRLTMPVLLLGGAQDALRDLDKIAARMEKLVPHLRVIILPEAGHVLYSTTCQIMPFLAGADKA